MTWSEVQIKDAWSHLRTNWGEVRVSERCVCIQCGFRFSSSEIREWLNPKTNGAYAAGPEPTGDSSEPFCPNCGMDYVLGDASGFPTDDSEFLKAMRPGA